MEIVKDLMVPVEQCAIAKQEMTVGYAIQVLMKSPEKQRGAQRGRSRCKALLVLDKDNQIVGELSQADIVLSMEQRYRDLKGSEAIAHTSTAVFSPALLKFILRRYSLWGESFEQRCQMVLNFRVKDCMYTLESDEYVQESDSLEVAIRQLAMGNHQSLLVRKGDGIVGILRLKDVFEQIASRWEHRSD